MEIQLKNITRPGSRTSILGSPTSESGNLGNRFSGLLRVLVMTTGIIGMAVFAFSAKTASASTLPKPPNNLGLVGYWSMDDATSTKATDFSGRGNTGTLTNMEVTDWVTGKRGKALTLDGGNTEYVSLPSTVLDGASNVTTVFWMKTTDTGAQAIVSGANATSNNEYLIFFGSNTSLQFYAGTNVSFTVSSISDNQWHHYAVVRDDTNNQVNVYIDGSANAGNPKALTMSTLAIDPGGFLIGQEQDSVGGGFDVNQSLNGSIDDVRIYNRALSATEVTALYNSGGVKFSNPNNLGLVGYWSMDDATGTKATDFSGRGYTGTLAGSPIPTWTNGKRGKALDFTSSASANRVLTSSFASITSTITISAWIYPTSYPSERATIVQGQTSNGYYMSLNSDGSLQTYWYGKSSQGYHSSGASTVPLNVWSHVVVVWNTDGPYLYVDGVLKNNVASTGTGTASTVINIGAESTTRQFIGKIDDVRIYSRALGAAEVAALYNSGAARVNATTATRNTGNLGSGLVGHWTFDGQYLNTTTSTDTSGQSNNGTLTGASGAQNNPQPTIGKLGQALKFDGTDDHVDLGTSNSLRPGTGDFSAVAWIKNLDNNQWNSFIGDRNSGSIGTVEGWAMSLRDSGDFSVILEDSALNTKYYDSPATYVDGIWHHLAFTWNAGTEALTLYADGLPLTPTKGSDEALGDISPTTRINIGRQPNNGNPYNGSIDDVRIYNRALSAAEVLQLYNQGK